MDIKETVTNAAKKIMADKKLQEMFMTDPVKAVETALGINLPKEITDPVVSGVKAMIAGDKVSEGISAIAGLFGKK